MTIGDPIGLRRKKYKPLPPPPTTERLKYIKEIGQYYAEWQPTLWATIRRTYDPTGPFKGLYVKLPGPQKNFDGEIRGHYYDLEVFFDRDQYKSKKHLWNHCAEYLRKIPHSRRVHDSYLKELKFIYNLHKRQLNQYSWNDSVREKVKIILFRLDALITLVTVFRCDAASWMVAAPLIERIKDITRQLHRSRFKDKSLMEKPLSEILKEENLI